MFNLQNKGHVRLLCQGLRPPYLLASSPLLKHSAHVSSLQENTKKRHSRATRYQFKDDLRLNTRCATQLPAASLRCFHFNHTLFPLQVQGVGNHHEHLLCSVKNKIKKGTVYLREAITLCYLEFNKTVLAV